MSTIKLLLLLGVVVTLGAIGYVVASHFNTVARAEEANNAIAKFDEMVLDREVSYDQKRNLAQSIHDLGVENDDPVVQARGLIRLARTDYLNAKVDGVVESALDEARRLLANDQSVAKAELLLYSGFYKDTWNQIRNKKDRTHDSVLLPDCLTELFEAISLSKMLKNDELYVQSCCKTAIVLMNHLHYEEAVRMACWSLEAAEASENERLMLDSIRSSMSVFGVSRFENQMKDLAKRYLEIDERGARVIDTFLVVTGASDTHMSDWQADINQRLKDPPTKIFPLRALVRDLILLASGYQAQEKSDEALTNLEAALALHRKANAKIPDKHATVDLLLRCAHASIETDDTPLAKKYFHELKAQNPDFKIFNRPEQIFAVSNALEEFEFAAKWGKEMIERRKQTGESSLGLAKKMAGIAWDGEIRSRKRKAAGLAAIQRDHVRQNLVRYGVLMFLVVSGIAGFRYQSIKKSHNDLEAKVAQRTNEFQNALAHAESATKSKREFLARVNHEIRNPLHAIIGCVELMQHGDRFKNDPRSATLLDGVRCSSEHLMSLVDDVIEVAKIEDGCYESSMVDFSVLQLASDLQNILGALATKKSVAFSVEVDCSDEPTVLHGDQTALRQILINLASNAINATENGNVEVTLSAALESNECAIFKAKIRDSGCGIPIEHQKQLFEPFVDFDRNSTGKGLGLFIAHSLVNWLNGDIQFESTLDFGTTFDVTLPFQPGVHEAATARSEDAHPKGLRVLVVDDKESIRQLVCGQLTMLDQQARACQQIDETLDMIKTWKPDVVLMDLRMPIHSGFDFLERMQQELEEVPFTIAMTGDATTETFRAASEAGFDDFLAKPFQKNHLVQALVGSKEAREARA